MESLFFVQTSFVNPADVRRTQRRSNFYVAISPSGTSIDMLKEACLVAMKITTGGETPEIWRTWEASISSVEYLGPVRTKERTAA